MMNIMKVMDTGHCTEQSTIDDKNKDVISTLNCCFSSFLSRKLFRPFVFTTFLNDGLQSVSISYVHIGYCNFDICHHLQVIGWMEELAILSSTSSFFYVVVARHNSVADGERGLKEVENIIQKKSISIGSDFHEQSWLTLPQNRYDSPNALLTKK